MHEVRIHGRGGQGAVLASAVLGAALAEEGKHIMAIPAFGFERRGAPVVAYLRFDDRPIRQVTNIYRPDVLLVIDPTVARTVDVFAGAAAGTILVQATAKGPGDLGVPKTVARVGTCDAVRIALAIFGRPITNTVMLGAFAKATGMVSPQALAAALADSEFRDAGLDQNIEAVRRGYDATAVLDRAAEAAA